METVRHGTVEAKSDFLEGDNTPFPTKCKTFEMKMGFYSHVSTNHFHIKGFALDLALKLRQKVTRKRPIKLTCS